MTRKQKKEIEWLKSLVVKKRPDQHLLSKEIWSITGKPKTIEIAENLLLAYKAKETTADKDGYVLNELKNGKDYKKYILGSEQHYLAKVICQCLAFMQDEIEEDTRGKDTRKFIPCVEENWYNAEVQEWNEIIVDCMGLLAGMQIDYKAGSGIVFEIERRDKEIWWFVEEFIEYLKLNKTQNDQ